MRRLRTLALLALALAPVAGCGDEKDQKPVIVWALPASVADLKGSAIGEIAPPPPVIAWGGADDLDKLGAGVQAFLTQVSPMMPDVLDLVKDELRRRLALTKLDGIDWKRPARVAVFDPKGMPQGSLAVFVPLANKDAFLATLPPARKENDEGNAISYRDDLGRFVYLNFIDNGVAITWDKKQFTDNADFIVRLARSTTPEGQAFFLSAKNVSTLYSKDIDDMIAQQKQQAASMNMSELQSEIYSRLVGWMVSSFKDLDRAEALPKILDDGARLSLRLRPKAGSELEKSFKAIEAHPHTLISRLPADAPLFASLSTNPGSADGLTQRLIEWAMSVGFGGKLPEGYAEAMKAYFKATSGEMAIAAHKPVSGEGLTLTTLLGVQDEAALRDAMRKSRDVFKDKATMDVYKKAGVKVDYRENAYKVGSVPVDTVEMSFEKGKNPYAQLGPFGEGVGELTTTSTAVSKDLAVIAYGKDGRKTVEAFLNGKVEGGLDKAAGPARALRLGVKDPVGILYISPIEIGRRIWLNGKNPIAEGLRDIAGTTGVALSFTAKDGVFEVVLDVPNEQAKNITQGAARSRMFMPQ